MSVNEITIPSMPYILKATKDVMVAAMLDMISDAATSFVFLNPWSVLVLTPANDKMKIEMAVNMMDLVLRWLLKRVLFSSSKQAIMPIDAIADNIIDFRRKLANSEFVSLMSLGLFSVDKAWIPLFRSPSTVNVPIIFNSN